MSEPTRDDLRVRSDMNHSEGEWVRRPTDEELEPIHRAWLRERVNPTCPDCGGRGYFSDCTRVEIGGLERNLETMRNPCPRCDGRGRLGVDLRNIEYCPSHDNGEFRDFARALLDLLGEEES